jgi:hypothetical protein
MLVNDCCGQRLWTLVFALKGGESWGKVVKFGGFREVTLQLHLSVHHDQPTDFQTATILINFATVFPRLIAAAI